VSTLDSIRARIEQRDKVLSGSWDLVVDEVGLGVRVRPYTFAEAASAFDAMSKHEADPEGAVDTAGELVARRVEAVFALNAFNQPEPLYDDESEAVLDERLHQANLPDGEDRPFVSGGVLLRKLIGDGPTMAALEQLIKPHMDVSVRRLGESVRLGQPGT
jgi:hypothetical protein